MKKEILILKNITREGPGLLEEILKEQNIIYKVVDLTKDEKFPPPENYGAVAILGGPDSANDETVKMQEERNFVKTVLDNNIPYIGICLGLQILVKVAGGAVYKSPFKEIGFRDHESHPFEVIMLTHVGEHDPLFEEMGENFRVFQLHGETVKLTPEMKQLAIGRLVKNQVVKIGEKAYGIQCHFELTPEMFEAWISEDPDLLKLDRNMLRSEFQAIQQEYNRVGRQLFKNFLKIVGF